MDILFSYERKDMTTSFYKPFEVIPSYTHIHSEIRFVTVPWFDGFYNSLSLRTFIQLQHPFLSTEEINCTENPLAASSAAVISIVKM